MANHTQILSTQSTVEFEDIAEILRKLLSTNQSINQSISQQWMIREYQSMVNCGIPTIILLFLSKGKKNF
jgi:hypothetical protein